MDTFSNIKLKCTHFYKFWMQPSIVLKQKNISHMWNQMLFDCRHWFPMHYFPTELKESINSSLRSMVVFSIILSNISPNYWWRHRWRLSTRKFDAINQITIGVANLFPRHRGAMTPRPTFLPSWRHSPTSLPGRIWVVQIPGFTKDRIVYWEIYSWIWGVVVWCYDDLRIIISILRNTNTYLHSILQIVIYHDTQIIINYYKRSSLVQWNRNIIQFWF